MPRFYYSDTLTPGQTLTLPASIQHHIRVLRLVAGTAITLFNDKGGEFSALLQIVEKNNARAEVISFLAREVELSYPVTLAQAITENSKMDWLIEKAVELGVASIQPLTTQRCVVRLSAERSASRMHHWQQLIIAATEQSGRNQLPTLLAPLGFNQWITESTESTQSSHSAQSDLSTRLLLSPRASQSLSGWAASQSPQALTLIIGPEGGLTTEEEQLAINAGALALKMGARILRTETASLAALAMLQSCWDKS